MEKDPKPTLREKLKFVSAEAYETSTTSGTQDSNGPNQKLILAPIPLNSSDNIGSSDDNFRERQKWSSQLDFIMSCVSFAVGLGNVWRFPYKAYKNGGGAFLIPYMICVVLCGVPVFFLEIALGQSMQQGVIGIWDIYPAMRGLGYASTVIAFLCNCYYIMVLVWGVFYFIKTIMGISQDQLPWESCNHTWARSNCFDEQLTVDALTQCVPKRPLEDTISSESPVKQFWKHRVLGLEATPEETSTELQTELFVILSVLWFVCYICIHKGTESSGKAVYVTATFPYIVLTSLFIRAVTLPGAMEGIWYLITPNFSKLTDAQIWIEAGTQVFFSYAIGLGALSALGSYNQRGANCYKHALIISAINSGTSMLAGLTVFAFLGVMSCQSGLDISMVANKGPGLAFITYPMGVTFMPHSEVWAVLFFLMLVSLGMGSQIVTVQGFITALYDILPRRPNAFWYRQEFLGAVVCSLCLAIGVQFTTKSGIWAFNIFDTYAASGTPLLWMVFFECVTVGWLYGADRFYADIESMIGFTPNIMFKLCWKFVTPLMTFAVFVYATFINYEPLTDSEFGFKYNWKHELMGWGLAVSSMICVPLGLLAYFVRGRRDSAIFSAAEDQPSWGITTVKPKPSSSSTTDDRRSGSDAIMTSKNAMV